MADKKPEKIKPTKAEKDERRAAGLPERFADVPLEDLPRGIRNRLERNKRPEPPVVSEPPLIVTPAVVPVSIVPSASDDPVGTTGAVTADDEFIYVKTDTGWKRSALETF